MHTSFAYGLVVHSELPLLPNSSDTDQPDVVVRCDLLEPDAFQQEKGQVIFAQVSPDIRLLIRDGREIVIDAPSDTDPQFLRGYILGAAMGVILRQRGLLVVHASCVAKDDIAIAFLGGSGWGKSTLASAFHAHGYRLVTDDVMAIQLNGSAPLVIPSFPEVRLLPDAAAAMGSPSSRTSLLYSLSHKQIQRLDRQFEACPVTLKQCYVLRIGECNGIEPLSRPQAFTELIQHSRATKTLADPNFQIQHFRQCSQLANAVPMAYLKRPRSLDQLPQLVAFIEAHLSILQPCTDLSDH
ncbi:MAG TPA: hypothetical protein V6D19_12030 [Stenomitos sp.]